MFNLTPANLITPFMMMWLFIVLGGLFLPTISASVVEQSTGFNSTFALTASQISAVGFTNEQADEFNIVVNFERSQLANGGPSKDLFYALPLLGNGSVSEAGIVLDVQDFTSTANFSVPPNTALSRIIYTTKDFNGTVIPASAFILWPFTPREFGLDSVENNGSKSIDRKAPIVLWTHGTSGFFANAAPSADRSLWYGYAAPFALAQAGYAVIAPDYAGLGISTSWDGSEIPHQYLMSPASARDALYSLEAASEAFNNRLDNKFAVMGHSQGGGVAWAVAEALASSPEFAHRLADYVGTIAGSPTTDALSGTLSFIVSWVSIYLQTIFSTFTMDKWLTPLGIARTELLREVQGGIGASTQLFLSVTIDQLLQPQWNESYYADAYAKLANSGGKKIEGPMLVLQGTSDVYVPYAVTTETVSKICQEFPESDLEYLVAEGVGHVPMLSATMHIWMQWLDDRFTGRTLTKRGCVQKQLSSFLPTEQYQAVGNSFLQWAGATKYSYETPLGP